MTVVGEHILNFYKGEIVTLLDLDLNPCGVNTIYHFTPALINHPSQQGSITWRGIEYELAPFSVEGFEHTARGQSSNPMLTVSNVLGNFSLLVGQYQELIGAKVTIHRTYYNYLDGMPDASTTFELPVYIYYIFRLAQESEISIQWELATPDRLNTKLPGRIITKRCPWLYRDVNCGYTGTAKFTEYDVPTSNPALDKCGLTFNSCYIRFNPNALRHGGFIAIDTIGGV